MAGKVRDYSKLAEDIIEAVGGKEHIVNATHCATRLRLVLKDCPADAKEKVTGLTGVITVVENSGQFQVVIGTHVTDVYDKVSDILQLDQNSAVVEEKKSILNRVIATMSAVFAPFIYVLAAAGILQGILILINLAVPSFANTGTYEVLSFMSWTPFTFLPIFIAITASKHFKCNMFIAVLCCCALVNPTWTEMAARITAGEDIKFLFFSLAGTSYTSTVLPPLFLVWVLSYVEKFVEKHLHDTIKALFTPLICLVVMVPLTMLLIGPASSLVATGIANGYNFLVATVPVVAAAVIGGFWQVAVIFGVHWGITPVILANFDLYGHDSFQVFQTCAVCAQMAAAFGVYIKSKNHEFKGVALSAGITGLFGITEPSIYGVTLRLKKPFICGCIAGAIGAISTTFFGSLQYVYAGLPGVLTCVNAISPDNSLSFIGMLIGIAISVIGSIVLVQIIGFEDPVPVKAAGATTNEAIPGDVQAEFAATEVEERANVETKTVRISSPFSGKLMPMSKVPDPVFAEEGLGKGVAVDPDNYKLHAPVDGVVETVFETKHALGFTTDSGVSVLIHIGLDTVKLGGKHFKINVKEGDRVKSGQVIGEIDGDAIKAAGYKLITPIIIANTDECSDIQISSSSGHTTTNRTILTASI